MSPFTLEEALEICEDFEDLKDTEFTMDTDTIYLVDDVVLCPFPKADKDAASPAASSTDAAEKPAPAKRGRKPAAAKTEEAKPAPATTSTDAATTEKPAPAKRGRKPAAANTEEAKPVPAATPAAETKPAAAASKRGGKK